MPIEHSALCIVFKVRNFSKCVKCHIYVPYPPFCNIMCHKWFYSTCFYQHARWLHDISTCVISFRTLVVNSLKYKKKMCWQQKSVYHIFENRLFCCFFHIRVGLINRLLICIHTACFGVNELIGFVLQLPKTEACAYEIQNRNYSKFRNVRLSSYKTRIAMHTLAAEKTV